MRRVWAHVCSHIFPLLFDSNFLKWNKMIDANFLFKCCCCCCFVCVRTNTKCQVSKKKKPHSSTATKKRICFHSVLSCFASSHFIWSLNSSNLINFHPMCIHQMRKWDEFKMFKFFRISPIECGGAYSRCCSKHSAYGLAGFDWHLLDYHHR